MRKIGYARVSSTHQNLDRQLGAFRAERVDVVFREKASGKSTKGRPELEKAIDERRTRRWEPQKCGLDSHRPIQVLWPFSPSMLCEMTEALQKPTKT